MNSDTGPAILLFLLITSACAAWFMIHQSRERARLDELKKMETDATAFMTRLARDGLKPIEVSIILQEGEFALLTERSALYETRAFRVYGGGGTRVGKVFLGRGVSESRQRWKQIDTGSLTLTTKRLAFDGSQENRTIRVSDVLSITPASMDAIEVNNQRRGKASVFTVSNPLIWVAVIQQVAKGQFNVERSPAGETAEIESDRSSSNIDSGGPSQRQKPIPSPEGKGFFSKGPTV